MQKLAVALTTQEEWNKYIKYAERNLRLRAGGQLPREFGNRENKGKDTCLYYGDRFKFAYPKPDDKIISLKEAIGEKENKEIIREREARGFEPKTGDWVMVSNDGKKWSKNIFIAKYQEKAIGQYICINESREQHYHDGLDFTVGHRAYIKPISLRCMRDCCINGKSALGCSWRYV